ncbi:type 2 isopentenyl-diphosphate Delta-isomerase [Peptococcaceae bacterium 1198_IL3148]
MRQSRKIDHINFALANVDKQAAGFADVKLLHCSLPELNWHDIDTSCQFLSKKLSAPILINAMTGGHPAVTEINRSLAKAARQAGIAIALGSQRAALEDISVANTFKVVREENPDGVVIANLSAGCSLAEAQRAVEMVQADAIQLHVNVPQELAMPEGDREFKGILANVAEIANQLPVPVIIKEVGFGMSRETVSQIYQTGVRIVDISGSGGTNFIAIEEGRHNDCVTDYAGDISDWGIPTVISIIEAMETDLPLVVVASGGVRSSHDIAKSLALGARVAGISRPLLQTLMDKGEEQLNQHVRQLIIGLRKIMLMCGAANVAELANVPAIITGQTSQWLRVRGIDINKYAQK